MGAEPGSGDLRRAPAAPATELFLPHTVLFLAYELSHQFNSRSASHTSEDGTEVIGEAAGKVEV